MKKLVYCYSNGNKVVHSSYVSSKTMLKEAGESKSVDIYECNEIQLDEILDNMRSGKYVRTFSFSSPLSH